MSDQGAHAVGSDEWLARAFGRRVRARLFGSHTPHPDGPVLVLLGGQPAAGKTQAQQAILTEHRGDDLVEVTGDDLRVHHPDYQKLARDHAFSMPNATAPVSGGLVRLAVERRLYDNTRTESGAWERSAEAATVLRTEQHRTLTDQHAVAWPRDYRAVFALAAARPGYFGRETAPTYLLLQADAERMICSLVFTPVARRNELNELRAEQRQRHAHLRRVLPPDLMP